MQSFPPIPRPFIPEFNSSLTISTPLSLSLIPAPLAPRQGNPNPCLEKSNITLEGEEVFEGNGTLTPDHKRHRNDKVRRPLHSHSARRHRSLRQSSHRTRKSLQVKERCTFCWHTTCRAKTVGREARIACHGCWKRLWDLAVCWSCGEMIMWTDDRGIGSEVVSLGWCFWHRACFGCLVCRTPMAVPAGVHGVGRGVQLDEVPLCGCCDVDLKNVGQREYLRNGVERKGLSVGKRPLQETDGASGDAMIHDHERSEERSVFEDGLIFKDVQIKNEYDGKRGLDHASNARQPNGIASIKKPGLEMISVPTHNLLQPSALNPKSQPKEPPKWMSLLPSNRDTSYRPLEPSQLPSYALQLPGNTRNSPKSQNQNSSQEIVVAAISVNSPLHIPIAAAEYISSLPAGERIARTQSTLHGMATPKKAPPPFPFFQNPRAPIVPSIDSSWGRNSQPQAYPGLVGKHSHRSNFSQPESITTAEYMERYVNTSKGEKETPASKVCILCGQSSASDTLVMAPNEKTYHCSCFACRVCHKAYDPLEDNMDGYICFGVFPSHRRCISNRAGVLLARLNQQ